jgi:hypothetical protein
MSSLNDLAGFAEAVMRLDASWSYDPISGRYRAENGRFMSKKAVEALVDSRISRLSKQLRQFTRMLADGQITLDQWQQSTREALKAAHVQAAIIGNGGRANMTATDWGKVGARLSSEYKFLEGFARDLLAQKASTPMALARIGMYAAAVKGSYWQGEEIRSGKQGYSLMQRILDPAAKHCDDCVRFARAGIVPLGNLPLPGSRCACRSNCRCSVRYLRGQAPVATV